MKDALKIEPIPAPTTHTAVTKESKSVYSSFVHSYIAAKEPVMLAQDANPIPKGKSSFNNDELHMLQKKNVLLTHLQVADVDDASVGENGANFNALLI